MPTKGAVVIYEATVRSAKRTMMIGYMGIIIGGVFLIVLTIASGELRLGCAVAWGCGCSTTIFSAGNRAIASLEEQTVFHDKTPGSTRA